MLPDFAADLAQRGPPLTAKEAADVVLDDAARAIAAAARDRLRREQERAPPAERAEEGVVARAIKSAAAAAARFPALAWAYFKNTRAANTLPGVPPAPVPARLRPPPTGDPTQAELDELEDAQDELFNAQAAVVVDPARVVGAQLAIEDTRRRINAARVAREKVYRAWESASTRAAAFRAMAAGVATDAYGFDWDAMADPPAPSPWAGLHLMDPVPEDEDGFDAAIAALDELPRLARAERADVVGERAAAAGELMKFWGARRNRPLLGPG